MPPLKYALKEWAVICRSLATGRQAILLRKGGIAESCDEFQAEHRRFWLFPTYQHQNAAALKPEARPYLEEVDKDRRSPGVLRLSLFADLVAIYHVHDLAPALMLGHLHDWSEDTVRSRFAYKRPGLYVCVLRTYRAPHAVEIPEEARYAGCHSWVELSSTPDTDGGTPILADKAIHDLLRSLDLVLNPTAFA